MAPRLSTAAVGLVLVLGLAACSGGKSDAPNTKFGIGDPQQVVSGPVVYGVDLENFIEVTPTSFTAVDLVDEPGIQIPDMEDGALFVVHYDVRVSAGEYSKVNLDDLGWERWFAWGVGEIGPVNLNYFNDPAVTGCRFPNSVAVSTEISQGDTVSLCQLFASADKNSRLDAFAFGPSSPGTDPRDIAMVWSTAGGGK